MKALKFEDGTTYCKDIEFSSFKNGEVFVTLDGLYKEEFRIPSERLGQVVDFLNESIQYLKEHEIIKD